MRFGMEELVPIVAKMAEKYTSKESSSIPYDTAQQLMEAVIYCVDECEKKEKNTLVASNMISAQQMYETGLRLVEEKTKKALDLYNEMMNGFSGYGNECLYDTVVKGFPEFFKWYDCQFGPQDTILTLDYPILVDLSGYTGIDRIYEYLFCIKMEQQFLRKFSPETVIRILSSYNSDYRRMIDNISEIVLTDVILHFLSGKQMSETDYKPEESKRLRDRLRKENLSDLRSKLQAVLEEMIREYYENDRELIGYLSKAIDNISVRIKNAAEYSITIDNIE